MQIRKILKRRLKDIQTSLINLLLFIFTRPSQPARLLKIPVPLLPYQTSASQRF